MANGGWRLAPDDVRCAMVAHIIRLPASRDGPGHPDVGKVARHGVATVPMAERNTDQARRPPKRETGVADPYRPSEDTTMDPVGKAIWFIESHYRQPLTLDAIADACAVSRFHLARAFAAVTGRSLMRYVRDRRLSAAADALARGSASILDVALEAGYASHEAFTRAFVGSFGLTPDQVRRLGDLSTLTLTEPLTMTLTETRRRGPVTPERFENLPTRTYAGIVQHYDTQDLAGIPDQWQRIGPRLGRIPGQQGDAAYGVCFNFVEGDGLDYLAGVAVAADAVVDDGLVTLRIPGQRYVVFRHTAHVAAVRDTFDAIWREWFPASGERPVDSPSLERYGPAFDPRTGLGGFELWIAVAGAD